MEPGASPWDIPAVIGWATLKEKESVLVPARSLQMFALIGLLSHTAGTAVSAPHFVGAE